MTESIKSLTVSQRYQLLGELQQDALQQEAERRGILQDEIQDQLRPSIAVHATATALVRMAKLTGHYQIFRAERESDFLSALAQDPIVNNALAKPGKINRAEQQSILDHVLDLHCKAYQPGFPRPLVKPKIHFFEEGRAVMGRHRIGYAESNLGHPPETYSINLNSKNPDIANLSEVLAYTIHEQTHLVLDQLAYAFLHDEIPSDSPLLEEAHNMLACKEARAWPDTRIVPEVYEEFCYERDAMNAESAVRECAQEIKSKHRWDFLSNSFHAVTGFLGYRKATLSAPPQPD